MVPELRFSEVGEVGESAGENFLRSEEQAPGPGASPQGNADSPRWLPVLPEGEDPRFNISK